MFVDVSYLNNRSKSHPDLKLYDQKRVTLKMITRAEFHTMNGQEQEVYIYRLARY